MTRTVSYSWQREGHAQLTGLLEGGTLMSQRGHESARAGSQKGRSIVLMHLWKQYWIAAGVLALLDCAEAAPAEQAAEPSRSRATIQQLMDARIDPAADVLWNSVAFIASAAGEEDRRPRTAAQWDVVRHSALSLIEAAGQLSLPGQHVASIEKEPGAGELRSWATQRLIDANPNAFTQHAQVLKTAAETALAAIDTKNADGLMIAGGLIDEACEACHRVYWYPHP